MLTYWETLTAIQSNVPVNDSYAQLWGKKSQGGYTVVTYTGTLPATLTGTEAGYLHRYKIYGNTEQTGTPTPDDPIVPSECGVRTENLLDRKNSVKGKFLGLQGEEGIQSNFSYTDFLKINASAPYTIMSYDTPLGGAAAICFYDADFNFIYGIVYANRYSINFTTETNIAYVRCSYKPTDRVSLSLGSTALPYEPYGYKLPLKSGSTPVDIYIGDDTISAEEYVDSGTGKIYRMVSGILTPVDPPVPFPNIPTSAGSTTISWAGEGLAPSQVELEYEKKR